MSLYTFTDTMAEISLEVSEREIYNDIRSEVQITESETIIDQEVEYGYITVYSDLLFPDPYNSVNVTLLAELPVIKWEKPFVSELWGGHFLTQAQCTTVGGTYKIGAFGEYFCWFDGKLSLATVYVQHRYSDRIELFVTGGTVIGGHTCGVKCKVAAVYKYLIQPEESHVETWMHTVKIRRKDSDSIKKYGRRVMNLVWPLGQPKAEMEATIEAYLERYKEPMPTINMKIQGTTDALIEQIFIRKISDCVTVENTAMGMPAVDFFINSATIIQDTGDLLEANWTLEQARDTELVSLWKWDVSKWDEGDVWAP